MLSAFLKTRGTRSRPTATPSYSRSSTRTTRPASSDAAIPAARICLPTNSVSVLAEREHVGLDARSKEGDVEHAVDGQAALSRGGPMMAAAPGMGRQQ